VAARKATEPGAEHFLPQRVSLPALREAAAGCHGCDLYLRAAQTVFGESELAPLVLATLHPSAILRAPDSAAREAAFQSLVKDLQLVARSLGKKAKL
jgi:DNA polymerase